MRKSGKASGDIVEELAAGFENDFGELTSKRGRKHDQGTGQGKPPKRLRAFHGTVPEDDADRMNRRRPPLDDDDRKEITQIVTKLRKAEDFADTLRTRLKGNKLALSILQESNGIKLDVDWTLCPEDCQPDHRLKDVRNKMIKEHLLSGKNVCFRS